MKPDDQQKKHEVVGQVGDDLAPAGRGLGQGRDIGGKRVALDKGEAVGI